MTPSARLWSDVSMICVCLRNATSLARLTSTIASPPSSTQIRPSPVPSTTGPTLRCVAT